MRKWLATLALLSLSFMVTGEAQRGAGPGGGAPPRATAGGGVEVPGWAARLDDPSQIKEKLQFVPNGSGYHATLGPSAIFWDPELTATPEYTVMATFTLTRQPASPEGYGLFIGGQDLLENTQRYTYFLVRGDGRYLIKKRSGTSTSNVGADWTEHAAVARPDASGRSTNTLSIRVGKDSVVFLANGKEVTKQPASGIDTEGVAGLRINHLLDVQIDGFAVDTD